MALLIYKQWHKPPNRKTTHFSNFQHLKYIGTRVGVLKNEEEENGLFGKIGGLFYENMDLAMVQNHIDDVSKKGNTVYRNIISIRVDERLNMGFELTEREQWQKFAQYHANTIAEKNGIKLSDFEYAAAAHGKCGEESYHLHMVFWDKNQSVGVNIVDPHIPDEIRNKIENDVADDVLLENGYDINSKIANDIRTALIKGIFSEELNVIYSEESDLQKHIPAIAATDLLKINPNIKYKGLYDMLDELNSERPRTGANKYAYMSDDFKNKLNIFTDMLIECSPKLKSEVERYLELTELRNNIYNSNDSNYGKYKSAVNKGKIYDEVYNRIGNKVLQYLKDNRNKAESLKSNFQSSGRKRTYSPPSRASQTLKLFEQISLSFKRMNQDIHADLESKGALNYGDLSKEAIKDLIYKNEDKGHEF